MPSVAVGRLETHQAGWRLRSVATAVRYLLQSAFRRGRLSAARDQQHTGDVSPTAGPEAHLAARLDPGTGCARVLLLQGWLFARQLVCSRHTTRCRVSGSDAIVRGASPRPFARAAGCGPHLQLGTSDNQAA